HKRRIDWEKFYIQVNKFGKARPILDLWHPEYKKPVFLFPSLFMFGLIVSLILLLINVHFFIDVFILYFCLLFVLSAIQNKSLKIGFLSVVAAFIQFYGYGSGYAESLLKVQILKQKPEIAF